ncbi:type II toxin-antitoxin system VapC family toxin [Methylomonas montana]|uniref:PIN domain-containing protein n=1 Tax=Methylomonas montana TaxID=3058963 RepID=UPI00265A661E|nr:type II toxin-antitoxin system VapC family toxin [Methylomonas montana]WKJ90938.1 type II toxin-antitoxin system VapC family toxin [Methylomonas montana]
MIGLDPNVLVRYIVQDDPAQAAIASAFIEKHCTETTPGFVNNVVLVELVWVLERGYGYDKTAILSLLKQMAATTELRLENLESVWQAIKAYEAGCAGFADCLIAVVNRQYACRATYTFDRRAAKNSGFELLPSTDG